VSGLIALKAACMIAGFMIEAISLGFTDKWFALPMVAIGFALLVFGVRL